MKRLMMMTAAIFTVAATAGLATAQERTVYLRPALDMGAQIDTALSGDSPARFRYLKEWDRRDECRTVRPVHREDLARYVAELINQPDGGHYMMVWAADGHLIKLHGPVSRIGNAVKDVCEAILAHARE